MKSSLFDSYFKRELNRKTKGKWEDEAKKERGRSFVGSRRRGCKGGLAAFDKSF